MRVALLVALFSLGGSALAEPWPAETWQESENLTGLDSNFNTNLSGAHWNPVTRTLWVAVNGPGSFLALVEDGDTFKVDEKDGKRGKWSPGGDLESITQVDYNEQAVYVMVEGADLIRKYDTSVYGVSTLKASWNIKAHVPTNGSAGSEGLAFVPDEHLEAAGFVDKDGELYTSQLGMGGLMFVAHQAGGRLYVFDLDPLDEKSVVFVGAYKTNSTESSGLEFDRSNGRLYAWHNIGLNTMEELDLGSTMVGSERKLRSLRSWTAPRTGNLEGIAFTPAKSHEHMAFITDDDAQTGRGLMVYRAFKPHLRTLNRQVQASSDDAEQGRRWEVTLTNKALELTYNEINQQVGLRFTNLQLPPKAHIISAYITFTTVAPPPTKLQIRGQRQPNALTFTEEPKNISSRPKTRARVLWAEPAWGSLVGHTRRSPELRDVVQEMVNLPDWEEGSPMAFFIYGYGQQVVSSFDADPASAPTLHIEFAP
jgi:hypothetical protein